MKIEFDTKKYVKDISKGKSYFHTFLNRENIAAGVPQAGTRSGRHAGSA
ncbi:hypothetical protein DYY67_0580 [Candidatus Nitrosotalea sp. TS]|nr:hypothetical protein [Candidatus Nitrosotalea sp. TS]NHI02541.1 hypothetical protein [Candidatus Nitrosotalea sp. TS]